MNTQGVQSQFLYDFENVFINLCGGGTALQSTYVAVRGRLSELRALFS